MPRLTNAERAKALELIKDGVNQTEIAKQLNTTRCTVGRLIKRISESGSTDDRPRTGRPRVMPADDNSWLEVPGNDRPFVCNFCGKTFRTFSNLKNHMVIHNDKPRYRCEQCGRGFTSANAVERHKRSHTGEKPYICEYCARGFTFLTTLKTHLRTHTGERPHKCHLCNHSCRTAGNLHHHMRVHKDIHGIIPRPINVKPSKSDAIPLFDYNNRLDDEAENKLRVFHGNLQKSVTDYGESSYKMETSDDSTESMHALNHEDVGGTVNELGNEDVNELDNEVVNELENDYLNETENARSYGNDDVVSDECKYERTREKNAYNRHIQQSETRRTVRKTDNVKLERIEQLFRDRKN